MKNRIKYFVYVLMLVASIFYVSCSSDDDNGAAPPEITFPSNGEQYEVIVGESINFTFLVKADGGYDSHTLESTANQGIILTDNSTPGDGAKDFTITGVYTAGDVSGPDGIKLTVVDQEGGESSAIINVDILNN